MREEEFELRVRADGMRWRHWYSQASRKRCLVEVSVSGFIFRRVTLSTSTVTIISGLTIDQAHEYLDEFAEPRE